MSHDYTLTKNVKHRIEAINKHPLTCHTCHKPLEAGDRIHVKNRSGHLRNPRYYHCTCWESLFIELPNLMEA